MPLQTDPALHYCERCRKMLNVKEFYLSNNTEKYPERYLNQCKKCITMHVDNWDPETYLWILEECDVPYIPETWYSIMQKYANNNKTMTGMTILGRYLSTMKIKQYKDYRYSDTEFLQQLTNSKKEMAMKQQGYSAAEIAAELASPPIPKDLPPRPEPVQQEPEDYFAQHAEGQEIEIDLTDEEKTMLRLKWGKTYRPEEWVRLEQLYEEMMQSYDIQGAGHIDTLKLICKTSLKANQLIDVGDGPLMSP